MILYELNAGGSRELWQRKDLGFEIRSLSGRMLETKAGREELLARLAQSGAEEKTVLLYGDPGMQNGMAEFLSGLPGTLTAIPVGSEAMMLDPGSGDPEHRARINAYLTYGGGENLDRMLRYIGWALFGLGREPEPPRVLPMDGIWSGDRVYGSLEEFLEQESREYPVYVGMLSHRSSWLQNRLSVENAIVQALNRRNIGVIPAFSAGEKSELLRSLDFDGVVDAFFSREGKLFIGGLINFQIHLIKGKDGMSIGRTSAMHFEKLGIPVFHPVVSFYTTREQWQAQNHPLARELNMAYLNPEMAGMIEPIALGFPEEGRTDYAPVEENVELFARRVESWMTLRRLPNSEKKLALVLHNAVCAGVEATLGKAFGLDAFESTVRLMRSLKERGCRIENIPENGRALRELFLEKKAFSDFRWTSVEDILASGGALYEMPVEPEYRACLAKLPQAMQASMIRTWGEPPGEGMVHGQNLVITGLRYGNLLVLIQPKRGCYGAKCTGEVCRILHDPTCPPTHQYLATYRYLEQNWGAKAVIHMGTDGSLEYLPGKASGLGAGDWPYQVLGGLLNFYPYHLGVPSEGTVAKRRAGASLVGYYPAGARGLSREDQSLLTLLDQVQEANALCNGQEQSLGRRLEEVLETRPRLKKLMACGADREEGLALVRSALLKAAQTGTCGDLHVFGEDPAEEEAVAYLCEVLRGEQTLPPDPEESANDYALRLEQTVRRELDRGQAELTELYERIFRCSRETEQLLDLLEGRYQPPSESGMPDENGRNILPPGRNFYGMQEDRIPSRTAWERGKDLADQLLKAYLQEEGRYPHKIAMNMISLDISRTHGEQMCQFLWLLGVRPVWDSLERMRGLEPIPLSRLGRPRIDVTLRISGVMRDTWPGAVSWMDQAVILVSGLEEPEEQN